MTLGEWVADEMEGTLKQLPWNPPETDDYRKGYVAALREVQERLTPHASRCPLRKH